MINEQEFGCVSMFVRCAYIADLLLLPACVAIIVKASKFLHNDSSTTINHSAKL